MTRKAPPDIQFTQSKNFEMEQSGFKSFREAAGPNRDATPLERQAINDVYALAAGYGAAKVTTAEIRAATSGKQRWLATRFTPPNDPRFGPLMLMLDALIDDQNHFQTKHGAFTPDDLFAANGKVVHEDGERMIHFPYRVPWITEPDKDAHLGGVRGDPVYRHPEQRGPFHSQTDIPIEFGKRTESEREWWEADSSEEELF